MPRFRLQISPKARQMAERLTLRELLLQVTVPALVHVGEDSLDAYGGIFFHPFHDLAVRERVLRRLASTTDIPPFAVADVEGGPRGPGLPDGVDFPPMLAHARCNDPALTQQVGRLSGACAKAACVDWALGPCVDIFAKPDSPMVSVRSPGFTAEQAATLGVAFSQGLQDEGLIATAKHFPGDGFDRLDQHLTVAVNPLPFDEWERGPGHVFRQLIQSGVKAVMPGHIALPAVDAGTSGHHPPPASLSGKLLTGLLKESLGFDGLIISDAVNMAGFCGYANYYDACAQFLEAGGDVLLFVLPDERYLCEMEARVRRGVLAEATLRDRAARILAMKEVQGLASGPRSQPPPFAPDPVELGELANRLAEGAVTLTRDRRGALPLSLGPGRRVLHVVLTTNDERYRPQMARFSDLLRETGAAVDEWTDPGCDRLFKAARDDGYDAIVCSVCAGIEYATNALRLHGPVARNMMHGWMHLGVPTVFIDHQHPGVHLDYAPLVDCALATFGSTDAALRRVVVILQGRVEARPPESLPPLLRSPHF